MAMDHHAEMVLRWNPAVKITTTNSNQVQDVIKSLVRCQAVLPVSTFTEFGEKTGSQHWARLLPVEEPQNVGTKFVATFPELPTIPLSVVFRRRPVVLNGSSEPLKPLQLSSIKRQMAGLYMLFRDGVVTTNVSINLTDASYDMYVESVCCQLLSSTEIDLFLLAPSTRITILESEEKKSREENNIDLRSPNISDASEILLGTIRAINEGENANIPRVFLLSGPAGVGKTHAVRTAVQCSRARIYSKFLRGSDIMASAGVSSTPGLSLEKHFMHLQRQSVDRICIVFLDECDALMSSHTATAMLGYQLDQVALRWKRIIVVAATNKIDSVPLLLRRAGRFEHALILQPPSLAQRHMILKSLVGEETPHVEEIAEMTIGFVPADLHALARKARVLSLSNTHSLATNLRKAMVDVGASALRDASLSKPPKATWDSIAGDAGGAKTALVQAIEWPRTKKKAFQRLGLAPPRGILLHGPPGCAKTTLARAAAGSESIAFLSLSPADVFASSYVGEAEATVRKAFATARAAAPCILFFDEIDAILGSESGGDNHQMNRSGGGASPESRVLSTFLNETDGLTSKEGDNVLVIGATNRPCTLDAALLRPGRFDKVIYVPPPDFDGRVAILENQLQQMTNTKNSLHLDIHHLASDEVTGKLTGAEIVGALREAATKHLRESLAADKTFTPKMKEENVERALRAVKPLLSNQEVLDEYTVFEKRRVNH